MPNITTFHVFIGQRGVRIASVWVENEPGLVLGNIFILVPVMVPIHSIPLHHCISILLGKQQVPSTGVGQEVSGTAGKKGHPFSFYYFQHHCKDRDVSSVYASNAFLRLIAIV